MIYNEDKKSIENLLKDNIFKLVKKYYYSVHKPHQTKKFNPGEGKINYAGRVFDEKEMINLVDSALDFWLTAGKYTEQFENKLSNFLGVRYSLLVNSGSSANLLAFTALTSPELGDRRINRGDEVITVAAAFPTTIAPIIQYGAVPVFVDISLPSYNLDVSQLESAFSEKTKAVFSAHTLGNPFDLNTVKKFCDKHNIWLIEDNCDALGSRYLYNGEWRYTGTFGDIGTSSFYPPHHITMGEGGAVYTNYPEIKRILLSMRDWGRDCWCPSGKDNTCGKRFEWQLGELPYGYDHKYIYSHFGYNLKSTDMQAAIGVAQIDKLPSFIEARKRNWRILREGLDDLSDIFILPEPPPDSDPSWFGFILTVKENTSFSRDEIVKYLEDNGIQTRMLFSGNIIHHPCFDEIRKRGHGFRVISNSLASKLSDFLSSSLPVTERVMRDTFWVGVYPGMREEMVNFMIENIKNFVKSR